MTTEADHPGSPIIDSMRLEEIGSGRFRARNVALEHGGSRPVVFGGQLLGQAIVAAGAVVPGKSPAAVQTVFCRPATTAEPLEIVAEVIQNGRSLATVAVVVTQGGKPTTSALVTLDTGDEDLIRHQRSMPVVPSPEDSVAATWAEPGTELRVVDGVDLGTAAATGDPIVHVWARFPGAPEEPVLDRALAAWYTDMFVMAAAMRPHEGVGFELAHRGISTGVINQSLFFHEPCPVGDWFLVSQEATYTGRGRYAGVGTLYDRRGTLLASFSQAGLVRAVPARHGDRRDDSRVM